MNLTIKVSKFGDLNEEQVITFPTESIVIEEWLDESKKPTPNRCKILMGQYKFQAKISRNDLLAKMVEGGRKNILIT